MTQNYDSIVVGTGPAGMAAATALANHGASVCVLDEQPAVGGQIYRNRTDTFVSDEAVLGADYAAGDALCQAFSTADLDHATGATVWQIDHEGQVSYAQNGVSHTVKAKRIILATGALERPMPFPGWNLPGVMTCGAAQVLMKSSGIIPGTPVIIAGQGPLIYLTAWQLLNAGVTVGAVLETTPLSNYLRASRHMLRFTDEWKDIGKGLSYMRTIKEAGVPRLSHITALVASDNEQETLSQLSFTHRGRRQILDCALLLVHQGVVPNVQLSRSLKLDHTWDNTRRYWSVACDDHGRSSCPTVFVAGDGQYIMGAPASEISGRLAAYAVLRELGIESDLGEEQRDRTKFRKHIAIRPFLDTLYQPPLAYLTPPDDTLVCRCEEVTAGQIREFVQLGCLGPNQAKAFGRAGMGPCQGRQCALTVNEIIATERQVPVSQVGYMNIRPPIKPVSLSSLASLAKPRNN